MPDKYQLRIILSSYHLARVVIKQNNIILSGYVEVTFENMDVDLEECELDEQWKSDNRYKSIRQTYSSLSNQILIFQWHLLIIVSHCTSQRLSRRMLQMMRSTIGLATQYIQDKGTLT